MLTVPWLITSYVKALYGGGGGNAPTIPPTPATRDGAAKNFARAPTGVEPETRPATRFQQQQRQQIQQTRQQPPLSQSHHQQQLQQQQQQRVEAKISTLPQQQSAAPPFSSSPSSPSPSKPSKVPVSSSVSPKSALPVATGRQPQVQQQQQQQQVQDTHLQLQEASASLSDENSTKTSTKTLVLKPSASEGRMSHDWAQKQVEQFTFSFEQADKDKSGSLSFAEVHNVLKAQGFKGSEEEAQFIFKHLDRDRNKTVSKDEFTAAIKNLPRLSIKEFCLRKIFKGLDRDGSGYLTRAEIADATKKELVGFDLSPERISDMLLFLVKDDDSKVDYEEFCRVFGIESTATVMKQVFTKLDADGSGFLSRDEVLEAVKAEHELKLSADKISDLVIHLVTDKDKKISYDEFIGVWLKQREQKKK